MGYYKIMWIPNSNVVWNMECEDVDKQSKKLYELLNDEIKINKWIEEYSKYYNLWLEKDDLSIFNLDFDINLRMRDAIKNVNKKIESDTLFYWFDVNRDINENFVWKKCPINGKDLIDLSSAYPDINRLVSFDEYLCFPFHDPFSLQYGNVNIDKDEFKLFIKFAKEHLDIEDKNVQEVDNETKKEWDKATRGEKKLQEIVNQLFPKWKQLLSDETYNKVVQKVKGENSH